MAFSLPRLPPTQPSWEQMQIWWQQVVEAVEGQEASQDALLAQIIAAQAAADAAAAAATAAQSTANTANSTANTVKRNDKISASWTSPGSVLSASDAGSNATITVAAHTRKYGDNSSLSVAGASLTGKSYSTTYYVYYDDPNTSDTTPTYSTTTNPNTAIANAAAGRHFVGKILTPASGGGGTTGGTVPPGGYWDGTGEIP